MITKAGGTATQFGRFFLRLASLRSARRRSSAADAPGLFRPLAHSGRRNHCVVPSVDQTMYQWREA